MRGIWQHSRVLYNKICCGEIAQLVTTEHIADRKILQSGDAVGELGLIFHIGDRDNGAIFREEACTGEATAMQSQAHHRDLEPEQVLSSSYCQSQGHIPSCHAH